MSLPEISPEGGDASLFLLSEVSPHDKPWDVHKATSLQVSKLYGAAELKTYAERVDVCAKWLQFALASQETGEMTLKLYSARFCRVRHCPVCQWRRSLMWRARFLKTLPRLTGDHPSARFIFLTLTVRNCPLSELRDTLAWMNKSWKRFSERKQFPATGFVKSVEVTRNQKDDSAHPHFHCLLMVESSYFVGRNYLSQAKWQELWKESLRIDYTPIVNVKSIKPKKVEGDLHEALMIALCETLKYSVKEDDLVHNKDWLVELTNQLHKTRAIAVGGLMKQYLSESEPEDLIHAEGESEEELAGSLKLIFDWSSYIKRYIKK